MERLNHVEIWTVQGARLNFTYDGCTFLSDMFISKDIFVLGHTYQVIKYVKGSCQFEATSCWHAVGSSWKNGKEKVTS